MFDAYIQHSEKTGLFRFQKSPDSTLSFLQVQSSLSCYVSDLLTPTEDVNPSQTLYQAAETSFLHSEVLPVYPGAPASCLPSQTPTRAPAALLCSLLAGLWLCSDSAALLLLNHHHPKPGIAWDLLHESRCMWKSLPFNLALPQRQLLPSFNRGKKPAVLLWSQRWE